MPPSGQAQAEPEAEDSAEAAPAVSAESLARAKARRAAWVNESRIVGISYLLNGFFLSLFALTGTASGLVGVAYAVPGVLACTAIAYLIHNGHSARFKDQSMSPFHSGICFLVCLVNVGFFPQMAFAYALVLFTAFITATYRSPKKLVISAMALTCLLFGLLTTGLGRTLQIPHASSWEQFLAWLFFVFTLGRNVMLSVFNTQTNRLLRQRSDLMTLSLAKIERLANYDELTGVLNRRRLLHILQDEMARTERNGAPVSVALFDLDHFKAVNDTLGHLAGDQVLHQFATTVQAQSRNTDRFGRYGGEEFLLILTETDPPKALLAIERIRSALALVDWQAVSPTLRVTFSAGVACYITGESAEALLNRADLGLYQAKESGRNCTRMG